MSRPASGTVEYVPPRRGEEQGHYKVRITCSDGSRPWIHLDAGPRSPQAEARAKERAAHYTETVRARGIVGVPQRRLARGVRLRSGSTAETVAEWFGRWFTQREKAGISSVDSDRGRFATHVEPLLGALPMREVTKRDVERLVEELDAKIRSAALKWKSVANVWTLVTKGFDEACHSKALALRVLEVSPAAGVRAPDRGARRAKAYLYPSEFLAVVTCDALPLAWRRSIALATCLYARASELRALEWGDVDIERGIVHVHRSIDREGNAKETKTGITRRLVAEPVLHPLLRAMHQEAEGKGRVLDLPGDRHLARGLRLVLREAGVARPELFADDATRKQMTWHDLRATGLTWLAIRGDDPLKIMQRAGHTSFQTTQLYVREAESVREGFGDVFPALPAALLESPGESITHPHRLPRSDRKERPFRPPNRPDSGGRSQKCPESQGVSGGGAGNRTTADEVRLATIAPDRAAEGGIDSATGGVSTRSKATSDESGRLDLDLGGVVETALSEALLIAAKAGRWRIVEQIAAELKARRAGASDAIGSAAILPIPGVR